MDSKIELVNENKNNIRSNEMKKNISIIVICLMALMTCSFAEGKHGTEVKQLRNEHKVTQKAENTAFRETLAGKTHEERVALKTEHRSTQQKENQDFRTQMEAKKAQWKAEKELKKANKLQKRGTDNTAAPSSETVGQ